MPYHYFAGGYLCYTTTLQGPRGCLCHTTTLQRGACAIPLLCRAIGGACAIPLLCRGCLGLCYTIEGLATQCRGAVALHTAGGFHTTGVVP